MINRRACLRSPPHPRCCPAITRAARTARQCPGRTGSCALSCLTRRAAPTDAVARVVADPLSEIWGQQVVVENKGGAGTNIGTEMVARADPDGYTMLVGSSCRWR